MKKQRSKSGEFESWRSYWDFRHEVARSWRYVRSSKAQAFLDSVAIGSRSRAVDIADKRKLFRAQVAYHDDFDLEIGEALPGPALPDRMMPLRDRATEGRVNPKGIPCLEHTAIAEARPWIGSLVSLGVFWTVRNLKVVDCTKDADRHPLYLGSEPSVENRTQAVWGDIARAFREPVTRDDNVADYAATQIIAEVFRVEGFDGVAYRSAFGTDCFNVALFDLDAAELLMCSLHEVRDVELKYAQRANPYYVKKDEQGETVLVRNVITDIRPI